MSNNLLQNLEKENNHANMIKYMNKRVNRRWNNQSVLQKFPRSDQKPYLPRILASLASPAGDKLQPQLSIDGLMISSNIVIDKAFRQEDMELKGKQNRCV